MPPAADAPIPPHALLAAPSAWVARFAPLVAPGGRVLDLACGYGRHARYFAARGRRVLAVDRDAGALATLAGVERVETLRADLEGGAWPLSAQRFDAIVVVNYLHRPLFDPLVAALREDGVLICETFARGNEAYGRPSNPDFLLAPGELLLAFGARLTVVGFEQGLEVREGRPAVVERIAAVGPARGWPPALPSA